MKLLKTEWQVIQKEGGEQFKCYMIWQRMAVVWHSDKQKKTEKDGDREE